MTGNPISAQPGQRGSLSVGEIACLACLILGGVLLMIPVAFGEQTKGWRGAQYALGLVGLLMALSSLISIFYFRRRRMAQDHLFHEPNLLVHWTYSPTEWQRFVGEDFVKQRADKWALFRIVALVSGVIGGGFLLFDPRGGGPWVAGVLLVLCIIIALVILFSTRLQRVRRLERPGETRIGMDGLWMSGELHVWKGWGARLEGCALEQGDPLCVAITYTVPAKNQRQTITVRVPVPAGQVSSATGLIETFHRHLAAG